jgi:hypothetical protein
MKQFASLFLLFISFISLAQYNPHDLKLSGTGLIYNGAFEIDGQRTLSYEKCRSQDNHTIYVKPELDPSVSVSTSSGWVELRYYLYRSSNNQLIRTKIQNLYNLGAYPTTVDAALIKQYCTIDITPSVSDGYYLRVEVIEGNCVGSWCWLTNAPNAWNFNRGTFTTNPSGVTIKEAVPRFSLSSKYGTDGSGTPLTCQSNITINGASTTCETKYLLEVIETDANLNLLISNANYAGAWFNGQVPTIWHLQHITQNYGNPQNGDVVNGPAPTLYNGWTMTDRTLANGNNNRYLIRLSVMDDTWTTKQMLIEVNGNCKMGKNEVDLAEFAASLNPMTPTEVEEIQFELRKSGVDVKSLSQIVKESPKTGHAALTINAFPNPATSTINLAINNDIDLKAVTLVNTAGQSFTVNAEKEGTGLYKLDVSQFKRGFYIIYVQSDGKFETVKIQLTED